MKIIILDLETKPQEDLIEFFMQSKIEIAKVKYEKDIVKAKEYKKEETVKKYLAEAKKVFDDATDAKVFKKAMSVDTDYCDIICIGIKETGKEAKLLSLQEFSEYIKTLDPLDNYKYVTFNGKSFDFPVLIKAGIKQKVDLPYRKFKEMCRKFHSVNHYDLMEIIGDGRDWKSLDTYLRIYLGRAKKEINFETASEKEIREHCLEDLNSTEDVYNKFKEICL